MTIKVSSVPIKAAQNGSNEKITKDALYGMTASAVTSCVKNHGAMVCSTEIPLHNVLCGVLNGHLVDVLGGKPLMVNDNFAARTIWVKLTVPEIFR